MLRATKDIKFGKGKGHISKGETFADRAALRKEAVKRAQPGLNDIAIQSYVDNGTLTEKDARRHASLGNPDE